MRHHRRRWNSVGEAKLAYKTSARAAAAAVEYGNVRTSASYSASASSSASSSFNAESANNFKERARRPTDTVCSSAEAAAAAPYVARLPRFFRGDPSARGARSSRLHISEWGISLWREEGYGSTYDLVFTVGGRSLTSTIYMNEEAWHGMRRMLAPCRSHRWWFDSINRLFAPYSATDSFFGVIQQNSGGMSQRGAYLRSATGAPPFNSEKAFGFRPPFHL